MEKHSLLSAFKKAIKNWWISLLVGAISIILGIICMFTPLATFATLSLIFVISFFCSGVLEVVFAITNREGISNWGWTLAMGIIDVIFGIILLNNMQLVPLMLCYLIAFRIMLQSMWGVGMSLDLQTLKVSGWGWLLALSVLGIFTAIILLFQPVVAGLFAVYIISFGFVSYGVLRVYLSLKLKTLNKYLPKED
jgi:uncharacterized membrane protein HdeD (DUF308 family)